MADERGMDVVVRKEVYLVTSHNCNTLPSMPSSHGLTACPHPRSPALASVHKLSRWALSMRPNLLKNLRSRIIRARENFILDTNLPCALLTPVALSNPAWTAKSQLVDLITRDPLPPSAASQPKVGRSRIIRVRENSPLANESLDERHNTAVEALRMNVFGCLAQAVISN